jgi:hypothetical protein
MEERGRDIRSLKEENKRLVEKCREEEIENDRLRKDTQYA